MAIFYAQPYDITALGFYFEDAETHLAKINTITNEYGEQVEKFELQFIDGNDLNSELANASDLLLRARHGALPKAKNATRGLCPNVKMIPWHQTNCRDAANLVARYNKSPSVTKTQPSVI